ncbi:hypothetical protein GGX14DRAFT_593941 [Mycena pura]|uniref:RING-type domain-containing protein n=1 Tax=Mycena pura TaxID=153505 RepID=A0AAD6Y1U9_9AGAR|nr:hypothetical protein GGX14DRAFT_593941 [Mycena pura]
MACGICYEGLASPVSLPCGHVFCRECLRCTAIKSCSVKHFCPACRAAYNVVVPALVPPNLRLHILPAILPDEASPPLLQVQSQSQSASSSPGSPLFLSPRTLPSPVPRVQPHSQGQPLRSASNLELGRTAAEADALRLCCAKWRRRAELHAAANTGLLGFARAARGAAVRMRAERDAARNQVDLLQKQLLELMAAESRCSVLKDASAGSGGSYREIRVTRRAPAKRRLPVFLAQQKQSKSASAAGFLDDEQSLLGPALKRRRLGPPPNVHFLAECGASYVGTSAIPSVARIGCAS